MFTLTKSFRFEASHQLPHHDGKCRRLHGHSWVLTIEVAGDALQTEGSAQGMLMDFSSVKAVVAPLIEDRLDHYHLNESLGLENPTSEAVAAWIYQAIRDDLPQLTAVTIEETCTCACRYQP